MHKMLKEIQELNEYFKKNFPSSLEECENTFKKSKSGGFIGYIPQFMVEYIPKNKSEVDFFKMFNEMVLLLKKSKIQQAEQIINNFFDNKIKFTFQKNFYKGRMISFGIIISNNVNNEKLFLKVFKSKYKEQPFAYRHGPYIESVVALFINSNLQDYNHFAKMYFANVNELYILSEYVESCINYEDDNKKIDLSKIEDYNEKSEIYTKFLEKYTGEYFNHYQAIKSIKGGCFRFLDFKSDNFIIWEDSLKNKYAKMVDYGFIISYKPEFKTL